MKVYPGQDPEILEYYNKQGYKGIILEATGLGQVPGKDSSNNWLPTIKRLTKIKGVKEIMYPGQNKFYRYKKNFKKEIDISDIIKKDLENLIS